MKKTDIDKFIVALEAKNSWGKNEVIDLFKEGNYPLTTLITPATLMVYQDSDSKGGFK